MKTKALISFAATAKLICAFVFTNADCWFSHEAAQILTLSARYLSRFLSSDLTCQLCKTASVLVAMVVVIFKKLYTLRKHAYAINRDFFSFKIENFQLKNFDIFLIFSQNIDCGYTLEPPRRGGSNEYPQSMFWSKNKKNMYTLANPSFTI